MQITKWCSCTTEQGNVNTPEPYEMKKGTMLILGDSMDSGIDEKRLGNSGSVKVRSFPGSTFHDLNHYFMKPLLRIKSCKVIQNIETNYGMIPGASSDSILDALQHLKPDIEIELPSCEVTISIPLKRIHNQTARKIIDSLNKKLVDLNLCRIDTSNIGNRDIGRRRLHLNNQDIKKLASNILAKLSNV